MTTTLINEPREEANQAVPQFYQVFGRVVQSDVPLSGAAHCAPEPAGIEISRAAGALVMGDESVFALYTSAGDLNYSVAWDGHAYTWTYPRAGTFAIAADGSAIQWDGSEAAYHDIVALLGGPILGFAMQLKGQLSLHGSTVVRDGLSFGLLAPSGFGKSTLAAELLRHGCELLSDDMLAVEWKADTPQALAGIALLKLWPDSLDRIVRTSDEPAAMPPESFVSWLDKRSVDPRLLGEVCVQAMSLGGLFVLNPRLTGCPVEVMRLRGIDALAALLAHTYQGHLLTREPALQASHLSAFQELAGAVPVFAVTYPRSYEHLEEISQGVVKTMATLSADED